MRRIIFISVALLANELFLLNYQIRTAIAAVDVPSPRVVKLIDDDWRFLKDDAAGAEAIDFEDSAWRKLSVPHDWSIEGPFDQKEPASGGGAFLPTGIGWYRKHFSLPAADKNGRVFIEFDGVMAHSEVWINGHSLGKRPFGYISFRYDMTGHLKFGDKQTNVLAVRCDNSKQPASRWYAGAGIYRHVHLEVVNPVHLDLWPQYITTTPRTEGEGEMVRIHSTIFNQSDSPQAVIVRTDIFDPEGQTVVGPIGVRQLHEKEIPAHDSAEIDENLLVDKPKSWDLDHPNLYRAQTNIMFHNTAKTVIDNSSATFGIREAKFDAATGFSLNGKNMKLKGVCLHNDAGGLGSAVPASVWQRRLEALKEIGVNAIRTSHNPPSPELLDACDRLGFLVMDETFDCWEVGKTKFDYHLDFDKWWKTDATDMLLRDRNHPSIVIWSGGNEIHDINANNDKGTQLYLPIQDLMHQIDPSRPVTLAVLQPNQHGVYRKGGLAEKMDIVGQNYREDEIVAEHNANPTFKILGTENQHDVKAWIKMRDNPAYAGQFLWTGFDYFGESRAWPTICHITGLVDRTGLMRGIGYQRQSWWSDKPMVYITRRERPTFTGNAATSAERLPRLYADWSPKAEPGAEQSVEVYSNCDEVDLILNDKSLGAQPRPADNASPRQWKVLFAAGTLKAVAKNGGKVVATDELRTAGKPAKIVLTSDHKQLPNNWEEVAFVRATVVDENGTTVPNATDPITFELTGPATIAAVDSADPAGHELFQTNIRKPFQGRCLAILHANADQGEIKLTATANGLTSDSVTIAAAETK